MRLFARPHILVQIPKQQLRQCAAQSVAAHAQAALESEAPQRQAAQDELAASIGLISDALIKVGSTLPESGSFPFEGTTICGVYFRRPVVWKEFRKCWCFQNNFVSVSTVSDQQVEQAEANVAAQQLLQQTAQNALAALQQDEGADSAALAAAQEELDAASKALSAAQEELMVAEQEHDAAQARKAAALVVLEEVMRNVHAITRDAEQLLAAIETSDESDFAVVVETIPMNMAPQMSSASTDGTEAKVRITSDGVVTDVEDVQLLVPVETDGMTEVRVKVTSEGVTAEAGDLQQSVPVVADSEIAVQVTSGVTAEAGDLQQSVPVVTDSEIAVQVEVTSEGVTAEAGDLQQSIPVVTDSETAVEVTSGVTAEAGDLQQSVPVVTDSETGVKVDIASEGVTAEAGDSQQSVPVVADSETAVQVEVTSEGVTAEVGDLQQSVPVVADSESAVQVEVTSEGVTAEAGDLQQSVPVVTDSQTAVQVEVTSEGVTAEAGDLQQSVPVVTDSQTAVQVEVTSEGVTAEAGDLQQSVPVVADSESAVQVEVTSEGVTAEAGDLALPVSSGATEDVTNQPDAADTEANVLMDLNAQAGAIASLLSGSSSEVISPEGTSSLDQAELVSPISDASSNQEGSSTGSDAPIEESSATPAGGSEADVLADLSTQVDSFASQLAGEVSEVSNTEEATPILREVPEPGATEQAVGGQEEPATDTDASNENQDLAAETAIEESGGGILEDLGAQADALASQMTSGGVSSDEAAASAADLEAEGVSSTEQAEVDGDQTGATNPESDVDGDTAAAAAAAVAPVDGALGDLAAQVEALSAQLAGTADVGFGEKMMSVESGDTDPLAPNEDSVEHAGATLVTLFEPPTAGLEQTKGDPVAPEADEQDADSSPETTGEKSGAEDDAVGAQEMETSSAETVAALEEAVAAAEQGAAEAEAQHGMAESRLAAAESQLSTAVAAVATAQTAVEQAEARLQETEQHAEAAAQVRLVVLRMRRNTMAENKSPLSRLFCRQIKFQRAIVLAKVEEQHKVLC